MKYDDVDAASCATSASHVEELSALRDAVIRIASHLDSIPPKPVIGVVSGRQVGVTGALDGLRQAVALAELRRRLDWFEVRAYSVIESPIPSELTGEPLWPLLPWTTTAETLSCCCALLITVEQIPAELDEALHTNLNVRHAQVYSADPSSAAVDPILALRRVVEPPALQNRLRYLQMSDPRAPHSPYFVFHAAGRPAPSSTDRNLGVLSDRLGLERVEPWQEIGPLDLAALVGGADLVLSDETTLGNLATGLGVQALPVPTDDAELSRCLHDAELSSATVGETSTDGDREFGPSVDAVFDDLGASVAVSTADWLADTAPQRLQALAHRLQLLDTANQGLRTLLEKERRVFMENLTLPAGGTGTDPHVKSSPSSSSTRRQLKAYEERIEHLEEEIGRIYGTRLMRSLKPLRRLYGRLRSSR